VGIDSQELKKIMMSKVDKVDLEMVIDMKSNKTDTDLAMKGLDIVHKQVTHMIVLVVELIKSCMNALSIHNDSDKTKHHKNLMYILQQAVNVCRWINDFDPQNVNIEDLVLPNDLKTLNAHSKSLV
jgi:DNA polymerase family B